MNKKKNVALMLPVLGGGGAERVASILSQYLMEHGYNVFIFTYIVNRKTDYDFCGKIVKIVPPDIALDKEKFPMLRQVLHILTLSKQVRGLKTKYDIDYSLSFMEELNWVNILSRKKDKAFIRICTILSERQEEMRGQLCYNKKLLRLIYNRADAIILMTEYCKKDMIQNYGIKEQIIHLIRNPIILNEVSEEIKEVWKYGENAVISVARLEKIKQQQYLIHAFAKIITKVPDARLLLVGQDTSSYARNLKQLVKKMNLTDYVIFVGQTKDVKYYLKNSKVFVLTSKTEGFPNSMIEAMAMGVPVVSVDCPGAPREILAPKTQYTGRQNVVEYGEYGILTPPLSGEKISGMGLGKAEEKLVEAVTEVLTDNKIYSRYKDSAVDLLKNYDKEVIGEEWNRLFGG